MFRGTRRKENRTCHWSLRSRIWVHLQLLMESYQKNFDRRIVSVPLFLLTAIDFSLFVVIRQLSLGQFYEYPSGSETSGDWCAIWNHHRVVFLQNKSFTTRWRNGSILFFPAFLWAVPYEQSLYFWTQFCKIHLMFIFFFPTKTHMRKVKLRQIKSYALSLTNLTFQRTLRSGSGVICKSEKSH